MTATIVPFHADEIDWDGAVSAPSAHERYTETAPGGLDWSRTTDDQPASTMLNERRVAAEYEKALIRREVQRRLVADERCALAIPEFQALRTRLARPPEAVAYRIDGWQPRGARVMLSAQFKAGKTTLVGNLLRSLVDGDPWLERDAVMPVSGSIALLDFEMSDLQLDSWIRAQQIRNDDRVIVASMRGRAATFNLLDDQIRGVWAGRLRACGASYVVLDCLRPVLDAIGLDEHSEAGRFLVAFDALLAEAGITEACIVHHMGHNGERARGDSRLRDWPDVEWRLTRQTATDQGAADPSAPRFITAYGRDVDIPESGLLYQPQTRRLSLIGGSRKEARHKVQVCAALDVVLSELLADPAVALNGSEITKALRARFSRDTARAALLLGTQTGALLQIDGPKNNAKLYRRHLAERDEKEAGSRSPKTAPFSEAIPEAEPKPNQTVSGLAEVGGGIPQSDVGAFAGAYIGAANSRTARNSQVA